MTKRLRKTIAVIAAAALALTSIAYWYWSPRIALYQLQAAARDRDAEAFNERIDYEQLRTSLKQQFGARLTGTPADGQGAGAAIGALLAGAALDKVVDALVRPEWVMVAMSHGELAKPWERPQPAPQDDGAKRPAPEWTMEREGPDRVVVYGAEPGASADAKRVGFVFERYGFADWKLVGVRLPAEP